MAFLAFNPVLLQFNEIVIQILIECFLYVIFDPLVELVEFNVLAFRSLEHFWCGLLCEAVLHELGGVLDDCFYDEVEKLLFVAFIEMVGIFREHESHESDFRAPD